VCRNVLIYLTVPAIAKVATKFADALAPDGWVFMAPSDPRLDPHAPLTATVTDRGIYYRRTERVRSATVPPMAAGTARAWARQPVRASPPPRPAKPAAARVPPPAVSASVSTAVHQLADHGDYVGARNLITKALVASPLDGELYFLSAVLAADEDVTASLGALDRAIYLEPQVPVSYLFAGQLRHSRGDVVGARRAYRSALQILETLAPEAPVPWTDEPARIMTTACRQALESLDDR
jgi:chemotaxis protein methyltransferase CheR